jgi:hypothetical protein
VEEKAVHLMVDKKQTWDQASVAFKGMIQGSTPSRPLKF